MKILHAVRSDGFAGVERHIARLARAQAQAGHTVVMVGGAAAHVRVETGGLVAHRSAVTTPDVVWALAQLSAAADVVHVHMTAAEVAATVASAWLSARGARLPPVVTTRHFARPRGTGPRPVASVTAAAARRHVRAQLAISAYVAAHIDGAAVVVSPGVDAAPDARRAVERAPVALLVQRLEAEKDGDVGLRAFAASGLAAEGWRLHVAGDGAARPGLEALAAGLGIDHATRFLGYRKDVPTLMDDAALLLAPCQIEGFGLSVLEAMSRGLPVVAADAGGHTELLAGLAQNALFGPGDALAAGAALRALATDPGARDAYARAEQARQRADFTLDAQVTATDAVYRSVL